MHRLSSHSRIQAEFIDPVCDLDWDRRALVHPQSTIFHTGAWARVLAKTYGHKPFYVHLFEGGTSVGLIPLMEVASLWTGKRGICLPFSDFCEPLLFEGSASGVLANKIIEIARRQGWRYFEIRGQKSFHISDKAATSFYGHLLDLRIGARRLFTSLRSSVRRAIRKAERSGLDVEVSRTQESMNQFYDLHVRTRRRQGLPSQPWSFFKNIYQEIIDPNRGFLVLAKRGSQPAAANIFFRHGKNALYKFGASDPGMWDLRASNLVMWEGIKFLTKEGIEGLHFGRTSLHNAGLRRFKLAWGTVEEIINYFRFDTGTDAWIVARDRVSGFHNKVFRRLPLVLNRFAGATLYPHLD